MRHAPALRRPAVVALVASCALAARAGATECGELRILQASLQAASRAEEVLHHAPQAREAQTRLKEVERKMQLACAPKRTTIAALPLGYVPLPPGSGSRVSFDPGEHWRLALTTPTGAAGGIIFSEPAVVEAPRNLHWEADPKTLRSPGDLLVAVATDVGLSIEEPSARRGTWRLEVRGKPLLVPLSELKACAAGKPAPLAGAHLSAATCQMLVSIEPIAGPGAVPARGRAVQIGEWQYSGRVAVELGDEELAEVTTLGPPPRLDLVLELAAPIAGVTDGKRLPVTLDANRQTTGGGAGIRLGQECGSDESCEKARFDVEIWYDRIFGVPFVRVAEAPGALRVGGTLTGKIADRLERAIAGQRVDGTVGGRHVRTTTDADGNYQLVGLGAGDVTVTPVGRRLSARAHGDSARTVTVGLSDAKAPTILIDRLFE